MCNITVDDLGIKLEKRAQQITFIHAKALRAKIIF